MKIISLWQPWASLIAYGLKEYETRHWFTSYRGPLLIHAAKRKMLAEDRKPWEEITEQVPGQFPSVDELPLGAVVAIANLTTCSQMSFLSNLRNCICLNDVTQIERSVGGWSPGRFAWKLENVRKLEPIPLRGQQGLWTAEDWLIEQVEGAIAVEEAR